MKGACSMPKLAEPEHDAEPAAGPRTGCSILIVDDEPLIRETLGEFLVSEGYDVAACGDAEEALATARERSFDIALCDVQLPGMDGIELLDRLAKISPQTFV